jgi:hypothetical protein
MSEPLNSPPNTDTRPKDIVRDQSESRASNDPRGEASTVPPPLPTTLQVLELSTPQEDNFRDIAQAVVYQVLKKVTVNGMPAQFSGDSFDFQLEKTSASEEWYKQNIVPALTLPPIPLPPPQFSVNELQTNPNSSPLVPRAENIKTDTDAAKVAEYNREGVHIGLGPAYKTGGSDIVDDDKKPLVRVNQQGDTVPVDDYKKHKRHEDKSEGGKKRDESNHIADRANPSYFGKSHVRVLLTRADHADKIVANIDIASSVVVENSENLDDDDDILPAESNYYFGGFGTKFYCWKDGVVGEIELAAHGKFRPLTT